MNILEFLNKELNDNYTYTSLNRVNWVYISIYQTLSEKFIEKLGDMVNWYYILQYQKLSKKFIQKHQNKIS